MEFILGENDKLENATIVAKKIYERFIFQLTDEGKVKVVTNCDHLKDLRFSYQNPYAFADS